MSSTSDGARRALDFLAPSDSTASRPPGFEDHLQRRSPPLLDDGPFGRSSGSSAPRAALTPLEPLFMAAPQPLLFSSPPPRRVANRRKTLAGMTVVRNITYSLRRASDRLRAKRSAKPVAQAAEAFICKGLGIVQDGQEVTELAMKEFARRFEGQIPDDVMQALRELFKVGSVEDDAIDDALLAHGGAAGLELAVDGADAASGAAV
jgi:hypothetical protein